MIQKDKFSLIVLEAKAALTKRKKEKKQPDVV